MTCDRVYTSGSRIIPIALKKLKMVPVKIRMVATSSLVTSAFNDNTSFHKSSEGDCSNKGKNANQ